MSQSLNDSAFINDSAIKAEPRKEGGVPHPPQKTGDDPVAGGQSPSQKGGNTKVTKMAANSGVFSNKYD